MRYYRKLITEKGQHSPDYLNEHVREVIDFLGKSKLSICDVGCGTGHHASILKEHYPFFEFVGVDFSEATINYLKNNDNIFDKVLWAESAKLPIEDKEVDAAISMENLEHLYYEDVLTALKELKRISNYIIITTPIPEMVINGRWLTEEISEAVADVIPLSPYDYTCLESCVHKSVIFPHSLLASGFKQVRPRKTESECYYVESEAFDISKIKFVGIRKSDIMTNCEYKNKYLDLLNKSLSFLYAG